MITVRNLKKSFGAKKAVNGVSFTERKLAADEKPEDKAKLDQEFQAKQVKLKEKLAREE